MDRVSMKDNWAKRRREGAGRNPRGAQRSRPFPRERRRSHDNLLKLLTTNDVAEGRLSPALADFRPARPSPARRQTADRRLSSKFQPIALAMTKG